MKIPELLVLPSVTLDGAALIGLAGCGGSGNIETDGKTGRSAVGRSVIIPNPP
jgi:hypothetical protein